MTADEVTLARLMVAAQAGDRVAYRRLLGLCVPLLERFFRRRIAEAAVDDLVQETLMSMHRKRDTWDASRRFLPWLAAIARYRWIDQLRRGYRAAETGLDEDISVDSGEAAIIARLGVDRLLGRLPMGQAAAIRAMRIEGLSVAEASVRLGQSESLIAVNVHRGLKKLALMVEDEE